MRTKKAIKKPTNKSPLKILHYRKNNNNNNDPRTSI